MFVASTQQPSRPLPACLGARVVANQVEANQVEAMRFRLTSVAAMVLEPLKLVPVLLPAEQRVLDWYRPVAPVRLHRAG